MCEFVPVSVTCLVQHPCPLGVCFTCTKQKKKRMTSVCASVPGSHVEGDFWIGKSLLITGGCGFLGKLVIEKILRCLPHVGTIYLLIRAKNSTPPQRLEKLLGMSHRITHHTMAKLTRIC